MRKIEFKEKVKNILEKAKEKFKDKKFVAIFSVIAVLVLAGGVYAAMEVTSDNEVAVKTEQEEAKVDDLKADMKKELALAKTEAEKKAIEKKYEEKLEKAESNHSSNSSNKGNSASKPASKPSSNSNTSSSGSSGSSASKPSHSHSWSPVYKTVTKTKIETVEKYVCNGKYFDDYDSGADYLYWCTKNGITAELHITNVDIEVPYTENVLSHYQCSCGATK